MVKMNVVYQGEKHCQSTHAPSQSNIETDAPKDNNGKGENFSPTDLVGAALGSCMLTVMGIHADKEGVSMQGSHCEITKEMTGAPRRIKRLTVQMHLPKSWTQEQRQVYENIAINCPVKLSLNPEIEVPINFTYDVVT